MVRFQTKQDPRLTKGMTTLLSGIGKHHFTLGDIESRVNKTGYKFVHEYSYHRDRVQYYFHLSVKSKNYATATEAADGFLAYLNGEVDERGEEILRVSSPSPSVTFQIPSPSSDWILLPKSLVWVDVDRRRERAVVLDVLPTGWFKVEIRTTSSSWEDWLAWTEEDKEWFRSDEVLMKFDDCLPAKFRKGCILSEDVSDEAKHLIKILKVKARTDRVLRGVSKEEYCVVWETSQLTASIPHLRFCVVSGNPKNTKHACSQIFIGDRRTDKVRGELSASLLDYMLKVAEDLGITL